MPRPTSTHEQREAVRALAVVVGIREAARQLGINEDRVRQWSKRFNWLPDPIVIQPDLPATMQNDLVTNVTDAANALTNTLIEQGKQTKHSLSGATLKAASRFEEMNGERIIEKSGRLLDITKVAATIHGWQDSQATSALNLNVLSGGRAIVQVNETKDSHEPNENSE